MLSLILLSLLYSNVYGNVLYSHDLNDVDSNSTHLHVEYVLLDKSNPCARRCAKGAPPMVCRYNFNIEYYHTFSKACYNCPLNVTDCYRPDCIIGDGSKRPVVAINRKIPGPAIEVCKDDIIVVDLFNKLGSEGTTIHWHGQHQKNTPYMDGVPYITQCPIPPHDAFRYMFRAEQSGTHFWHSHIGLQRSDGAYGAMIVRIPEEEDPASQFYDYDLMQHVMVLTDWEQETALNKFLGHHHSDVDNKPTSLLINGFGMFQEFVNDDNETVYTPTARFKVEQGYRYRFRTINAGFLNCPIEISVDNHTLKVITTDADTIQPVDATSLVSYAGERFDFIINADQKKGLYWMRFKGLMDCDERFLKAFQVAVLEYDGLETTVNDYPDGQPTYNNSHRDGLQVNALNIGTESNSSFISMPQLESLQEWDDSLKTRPDYQFYIAYDFYKIDNKEFHTAPYYGFFNVSKPEFQLLTPQFNHITMEMPPFPLLPQRDEIPENMFCNEETLRHKNCSKDHCQCPHGIKVPLDSVVELVFVDEGFAYDANHPLHLHGYSFRVVAMERLGQNVTVEQVKAHDRAGRIHRNLLNAPLKDTVTVPDGGYTIVRFKASNPGYWIFHCHLEFHAEIGMAMVIQVGEKDQMVPVPKNFPRCGNYMPDINSSGEQIDYVSSSSANLRTSIFVVLGVTLLNILYR